jgi:hypothetical protein
MRLVKCQPSSKRVDTRSIAERHFLKPYIVDDLALKDMQMAAHDYGGAITHRPVLGKVRNGVVFDAHVESLGESLGSL